MAVQRFPRNLTKIQQTQARFDKTSKGTVTGFWDPKEGKNNIRVLPPWDSEGIWYYQIPYHYGIGPEKAAVICPKRYQGKRCYICEKVQEFRQSSNKEVQQLATDLRAKTRVYYNVVDLDHPDEGVQVFGSGVLIFKDLLYYDTDEEWGDITNPDEGYDIIVTREGKGRSSSYQVKAKKLSSAIDNEKWLEDLKDLRIFGNNVKSYQELKELYEAEGDDSSTAIEEETPPPKRVMEMEDVSEEIVEKPAPKAKVEVQKPIPEKKKEAVVEVEEIVEEEFVEEVEETTSELPGCFGIAYTDDDECGDCAENANCKKKFIETSKKKKK